AFTKAGRHGLGICAPLSVKSHEGDVDDAKSRGESARVGDMDGDVVVTEEQWQAERARTRRLAFLSSGLGFLLVPGVGLIGLLLTDATASGTARYPVLAGWLFALCTPSTFALVRTSLVQQRKSDDVVATLARQSAEAARVANQGAVQREAQAKRQESESRLA